MKSLHVNILVQSLDQFSEVYLHRHQEDIAVRYYYIVSDAEFKDRYDFAADELNAFGIETPRDLRYWTSLYRPGTEVEKGPDGAFTLVPNSRSLRADCMAAFENGASSMRH